MLLAVHIYKCMMTDVSLKVEIVKNNNKFHENIFGDILHPSMPKILKWLSRSQNLTVNDCGSDNKS